MIKIKFNFLTNSIVYDEDSLVNGLAIENKSLFKEVINDLKREEGNTKTFIFSIDNKPENHKKWFIFINDFFNLDLETTSITNKALKYLKDNFCNDLTEDITTVTLSIEQLLDKLSSISTFSFKYDLNVDLIKCLKLSNFSLSIDEEMSFLEKLTYYLDVLFLLNKECIFILINSHSVFDDNDYKELIKIANYKKWNLLFIDTKAIDFIVDKISYKIIDNALCEII